MTAKAPNAVLNVQLQGHDQAFAAVGWHAPQEVEGHQMTPGTAVVFVDVIRNTTTMTAVLAAGADPVFVEVKTDDGVDLLAKYRRVVPTTPLILGGEKNGMPIHGGRFGNSALDVPSNLGGLGAVMCSTNGGRSFNAVTNLIDSTSGVDVYVMCMANVAAVADAIAAAGTKRVIIASGGFYGRVSVEDGVAGGRLLHRLGFASTDLDDGAITMIGLANLFADDGTLVDALQHNRIGRALAHYGRAVDIPAAITGAGIDPDLWAAMTTTVGRVDWLKDLPYITTNPKESTTR